MNDMSALKIYFLISGGIVGMMILLAWGLL